MALRANKSILTKELEGETRVSEKDLVFLGSPSDKGVQNNGGRLGSRLGPAAILAALKKLNQSEIKSTLFYSTVTSNEAEAADYMAATKEAIISLKDHLSSMFPFVHVGGGHDHVYVLLKALYEKGHRNILILNLDPHCDTRVSKIAHSGNPFRRFTDECSDWSGRLVQIGISEMNNNDETLEGVRNMDVFNFEQLRVLSENFSKDLCLNDFVSKKVIDECDYVVLSIDADVIEGSLMEAVSAVSYKGIPVHYLRSLSTSLLRGLDKPYALGLYEYNPLYDNLSNKGSRYLAGLIYDYWRLSAFSS